jgi:hypothetical protein
MSSVAWFIGTACVALSACADSGTDHPEGTYQLAIDLRSMTNYTVDGGPIPSPVSWPRSADLTLRFDDYGGAKVELLGTYTTVWQQNVLTNGKNSGSLELELGSPFKPTIDDLIACPQHPDHFGSHLELYFSDGHVHGVMLGEVECNLPEQGYPIEGFAWDISGERVSD